MKSPGKVGAVWPSSARLSRQIVAAADVSGADLVAELGPGTGPITTEIVKALKPGARFVAVEINPVFAAQITARFPRAEVIEASAENLLQLLTERNLPKADRIVCGLPWTAFPTDLQVRILNAVMTSLAPQGRFVTFAYAPFNHLPRGAHFHELLRARFGSVAKSRLVLNMPPAFSYICSQPRQD